MTFIRTPNIAGINPDFKNSTEQGENTEQDQKLVREALKSAYQKNISTKLKAELENSDANNCSSTKNGSASNSLLCLPLLQSSFQVQMSLYFSSLLVLS